MKISRLIVKNYKSINKPQSILIGNEIVTILGKNGSGKSNYLAALYELFDNDPNFSNYKQVKASFEIEIELNEDDLNKIDSVVAVNDKNKILKVDFNYDEPRVKKILCPFINANIDHLKSEIKVTYDKIKESSKIYIHELKHLELERSINKQQKFENLVTIEDGNIWNQNAKIEMIIKSIDNDVQSIYKFINEVYKEKYITIDKYHIPHLFFYKKYEPIQIEYRTVKLSPLERKFISIKSQDLKQEIDKINSLLKKYSEDIDDNIGKFVELAEKVQSVLYLDEENYYIKKDENNQKYASFIGEISKVISKNIYLLDNEKSLIFGDARRKNSFFYQNMNMKNPLERSFYIYCIENGYIDKNQKDLALKDYDEKNKEILREYFEIFVNSKLPRFDKQMFESIQVAIVNNTFVLSVIENSGNIVDFNDTSLGRRWYFSYFFIKQCLKNGDIFLIDEPASFLHPEAQKEVLEDLENLVKTGIIVIICTHSPYMISSKLSTFYSMILDENGSILELRDISKLSSIRSELGLIGFNDMILNIEKIHLLVEGPRDVACLKAFIRILDIDRNKYYINFIEGHTKSDVIIRYYTKNHMKYILILDADCENNHKGKNDVIFVGRGTLELSIEGLFSEKDKKVYFEKEGLKRKVSIQKIEQITIDSVEKLTLNNFNNLFQEIEIFTS